jgi:DNA invertase Pin-like site-specific DNA recombinase
MSTPTTKTAWVYIRESKDASAAGHNPDNQERLCRALADAKGLTIVHTALEIKPAASMKKRPTWRTVQRAALRHEFDALIVWEYSRIARNTTDWMHFISRALAAGVDVHSTDKQEAAIDWHKPMGIGMLAMVGSFNEMERLKTRERTMQGNQMRVLKGMPPVGQKPPYGYAWVEERSTTLLTGASKVRKVRLTPDAVEAPRLQAIWNYLDTPDPEHTVTACVNWLNLVQHWPAPMRILGGMWTTNTLRHLLRQGYYWGEGEAFRRVTVDVRVADPLTGELDIERRQRDRPVDERIKLSVDAVPPLISAEQAARVHTYLAEKANRRHYRATTQAGAPSKRLRRTWTPDEFLLLGGLIRCGVCGHQMFPRRRPGKSDAYVCASGALYPKGHEKRHTLSALARTADAYAIERTIALLYTPGEADAAFGRLADEQDETDADLTVALADLARTESTLAAHRKLAEVLSEAEVAQFAHTLKELQATRASQAERVDKLRGVYAHIQSLASTLARVVASARARTQEAERAAGASLATDIVGGLVIVPSGDASHQPQWFSKAEAVAAIDFAQANPEAQRVVLRALGVHVVVLARDKQERAPGRAYVKGTDRLRYDLPLAVSSAVGDAVVGVDAGAAGASVPNASDVSDASDSRGARGDNNTLQAHMMIDQHTRKIALESWIYVSIGMASTYWMANATPQATPSASAAWRGELVALSMRARKGGRSPSRANA